MRNRILGLWVSVVASAFLLTAETEFTGSQCCHTKIYASYQRIALAISSGYVTGSVSLGAIRMEQGDLDEAIRLWNDALGKAPH